MYAYGSQSVIKSPTDRPTIRECNKYQTKAILALDGYTYVFRVRPSDSRAHLRTLEGTRQIDSWPFNHIHQMRAFYKSLIRDGARRVSHT